jgi:ABC-type transporter Mla subunit MlaD
MDPDSKGAAMGDVESAWKEVGEKFTELGYKFRDHYRKLEAEREESGETTEESEQAFKKVTDELDTAFSSVGNAFRDAEVKDDAKAAANALLAAFGATFQEVGDALQRAIGRTESDLESEATPGDAAEEAADTVEEVAGEAEKAAEEATEEDPPPADV